VFVVPDDLAARERFLARTTYNLEVVDSHTCGQPTRVVTTGADVAPGTNPNDVRHMLSAEQDWIRRVVVMEPRGHRSMFGVVLIPPAAAGGKFGLVYMDANGYPNLCGHATIGAVTTLYEIGYLDPPTRDYSGEVTIDLDVPAGILQANVQFVSGRVKSVAVRAPLTFFLGSIDLNLPSGIVEADIAYAGQWYAYVPVAAIQAHIEPSEIDKLVGSASVVRRALADQLTLHDPMTGKVVEVGNVVWTSDADHPNADARNVPVSSSGSFDRSPCGTATCAQMAVRAAKRRLSVGEPFVNQGLVGTLFEGKLLGVTEQNGITGYIPEVRGSAWLTAHAVFGVDARDPLGGGFLA